MSSHFTYEIDERKLRVRLKDMEETPGVEAWASFDTYCQSKSSQHSGGRMPDIQLPLNRNVIVPVIFGVLIIVFSFILYNFINIKKVPENASQTPANNVVIPSTQIQENHSPEPIPVSPAQVPSTGGGENNAVKASQPSIVREENIKPADANKPGTTTATTLTSQNKQPPATTTQSTALTTSPAVATTTVARTEPVTKPKRNKRSEIVDNDSTPEARPAIGSDDRDSGERPN